MRRRESGVLNGAIPEESPSLSRVAYNRLREDILSNMLEPDQPLRLEFLRRRYGLTSPLGARR